MIDHSKMTRRRLLGHTARLTVAAFASSILPPNVRRALAAQPPTASLRDIKHVVLLMQENRSFADGVNGPICMGYHTRADIPFQFALAEAFTICDAYHCSVLGPTWPNRLYWMTGSIDADGEHGGPGYQQQDA